MVGDLPPAAREEVMIGCPGHRHRITTFHIADSLTGRLVRIEYERDDGRVYRPEGE